MIIAIIPARKGSKGVPYKNLRKLGGISIVKRAVDFALDSSHINRVILSTESVDISRDVCELLSEAEFGRIEEGDVRFINNSFAIHKRRRLHAEDSARTIELVIDIIESCKLKDSDYILLLQPTSPFRSDKEIKELLDLSKDCGTNSIVSAKLFDSPHPSKAFALNQAGQLELSSFDSLSRPRQELERFYVFDGSYYLSRVSTVRNCNSLLSPITNIYIREGIRTLNIDNEEDLEIAELIFDHKSEHFD